MFWEISASLTNHFLTCVDLKNKYFYFVAYFKHQRKIQYINLKCDYLENMIYFLNLSILIFFNGVICKLYNFKIILEIILSLLPLSNMSNYLLL